MFTGFVSQHNRLRQVAANEIPESGGKVALTVETDRDLISLHFANLAALESFERSLGNAVIALRDEIDSSIVTVP